MTFSFCRWHVLAASLLCAGLACAEAPSSDGRLPLPEPSGPRLVFVVAPGASELDLDEAIRAGRAPNLAALAHRATLTPPAPAQMDAVIQSVHTGLPPSAHGSFDGTARRPNSYERLEMQRVAPARVREGRVAPPLFEDLNEVPAFWTGLSAAGIPLSILFPSSVMPVKGKGKRVLAGGLPNVAGRRSGARLLVRPGEIPQVNVEPEPEPETSEAPAGRRGRGRNRRAEPEAQTATESEAARPPSGPPEGVTLLRSLSAGVWLSDLPLTVLGVGGDPKTLVAQVVVREQGETAVIQAGNSEIELMVGERSPWVAVRFAAGDLALPARTRFHMLSRAPLQILVEDPTVDPYDPFFSVSDPPELLASIAGRAGPGPLSHALGEIENDGSRFAEERFRLARLDDDCQWRTDALIAELEASESRLLLVQLEVAARAAALGQKAAGLASLDRALGRIRARLRNSDTLVVLSPIGTGRSVRELDLNAWLEQKRYLKRDSDGTIDWSRTQAYSVGQGAIYLNVKGREPDGSVLPARVGRFAKKIAKELKGIRDSGQRPVRTVWVADEDFSGEARGEAPDLMVGLASGYAARRVLALGRGGEAVFSSSAGPGLSGPGAGDGAQGWVLASRPLAVDEATAMDVAATAYAFLGVARSANSGRAWFAPPAP